MGIEITDNFVFNPRQRERFISQTGELWQEWADKYPAIFDEDDCRLARSQAYSLSAHFYEWLAAILLYHSMGYLSLIEKYQEKNHIRKQDVLQQFVSRKLISDELFDLIMNGKQHGYGDVQGPDLFVYAPDLSDWFFCEVKGLTDSVKPAPERYFVKLEEVSGKQIRVIKFHAKTTN